MAKNQQVLLVDADVDHRAAVKQMLGGMAYDVVGEANYGVEATRRAAELQPDLVLVHVEDPLALALRTLDIVQQAAPHAAPVVISKRDDGATARKAMLAGARGYVVSPTTAAALHEVLSAASERQARILKPSAPVADGESTLTFEPDPVATGGYVVTVFGPKGGVGKTTIATNLAVALRRHSSARVVLVDVDAYFGDVAVMMGVEPDRTLLDLLNAFQDNQDNKNIPIESYLTQHTSGLYLLAARHTVDIGQLPDADAIAQLLKTLAGWFDFVVVDTPGAFGPQVAAALDESTTVLLVTSADIASIKDARLALETLRGAGFDRDRLKLVVNHATNADSISTTEIGRTVNYDVFWTLPHDRAVPASTQAGTPLVLSDPKARMAKQVDALASYFAGSGHGAGAGQAAPVPLEQPRRRRWFWQAAS